MASSLTIDVIFCAASAAAALSAAGRSAYGPTWTVKGLSLVAVAFWPMLSAVAAASATLVNGPTVNVNLWVDVAADLIAVPRLIAALRLASAGMTDTSSRTLAQPRSTPER